LIVVLGRERVLLKDSFGFPNPIDCSKIFISLGLLK